MARGPLPEKFFLELLEKIKKLIEIENLSKNFHFAFGTFAVVDNDGDVHNILVDVRGGKPPSVNCITKTAEDDIAYDLGEDELDDHDKLNESKVEHNANSTTELNLANSRHFIIGETIGGIRYLIGVDICFDIKIGAAYTDIDKAIFSAALNESSSELLLESASLTHIDNCIVLAIAKDLFPLNVLHLVASNSIGEWSNHTLAENRTIIQADPTVYKNGGLVATFEKNKTINDIPPERIIKLENYPFVDTATALIYDHIKLGFVNQKLRNLIESQNNLFIELAAHQLYRAQHPQMKNFLDHRINEIIINDFFNKIEKLTEISEYTKKLFAFIKGQFDIEDKEIRYQNSEKLLSFLEEYVVTLINSIQNSIGSFIGRYRLSPDLARYVGELEDALNREMKQDLEGPYYPGASILESRDIIKSINGMKESQIRIPNPLLMGKISADPSAPIGLSIDDVNSQMVSVNKDLIIRELNSFIELDQLRILLIRMRDTLKYANTRTNNIECIQQLKQWAQDGSLNQQQIQYILNNKPLIKLCRIIDLSAMKVIIEVETFYNLIRDKLLGIDDILMIKRNFADLLRETSVFKNVFANINFDDFKRLSLQQKQNIIGIEYMKFHLSKKSNASGSSSSSADFKSNTEPMVVDEGGLHSSAVSSSASSASPHGLFGSPSQHSLSGHKRKHEDNANILDLTQDHFKKKKLS